MFLLFLLSGEFLIINGCWILSKAFSASTEIIIWFLFFNLVMWCITFIDLYILKNPCIPGIKPIWSWCMIFLKPLLGCYFPLGILLQFSSVQSFSRAQLWVLRLYRLQHARLPCPSPTLRACSNSCPLSPWWYPSISSSVIPFSSRLQSFPTSGSFPISQFFTSGGQSIEVSASASVLSVNIQDWFPLELNSSWGLYILVPCCFKREQNTLKKYMV